MKRKVIYSMMFVTMITLFLTKVFAAGSSSDMGNSIKNTVDNSANMVQNGAEHVGNIMNTEGEMIKNTTADIGNTIAGIPNVAWMWIIVAIVLAVLIWFIYKYIKEKDDD